MGSSKHAKHAKPALHPTRSTLSVAATTVLVSLCLASPALADPLVTPTVQPAAQPVAAPLSLTAAATMSAAPAVSPTATTPTLVAPAVMARKAAVTMRISGPTGSVSPGDHVIGVRLLADGVHLRDAYVRVERWGASGWEYVGRMITDAEGLARQPFGFASTTRVRALYEGSATRTTGLSPEVGVTIADFRQQALRIASQQAGKPYRYGSVGPDAFDCSGLVKYAFARAGKTLPRTSQDMLRATQRVANDAKQPGDLVFTQTGGRVGHVGIYAGDGSIWVAPRSGDVVKLQRIYTTSYVVGRIG